MFSLRIGMEGSTLDIAISNCVSGAQPPATAIGAHRRGGFASWVVKLFCFLVIGQLFIIIADYRLIHRAQIPQIASAQMISLGRISRAVSAPIVGNRGRDFMKKLHMRGRCSIVTFSVLKKVLTFHLRIQEELKRSASDRFCSALVRRGLAQG